MGAVQEVKTFLDGFSTEDFYDKIFKGPVSKDEFCYVVTGGVRFTSPEEREIVRRSLVEVGVPPSCVQSDEQLVDAVQVIWRRSVAVR